MPKTNPLAQGLARQTVTVQRLTKPATLASRAGRVLVGAHFAPQVQTALRVIAAEERTTMQALLAEGINTIFARRHKPEIALIFPSE